MDIKSICDNYKKLSKKASRELSLNEIAQMKCGFKRLVRAIESGELAPVVHGRWILVDERTAACSACGDCVDDDSPFCPNCGAKMGLEGEPKSGNVDDKDIIDWLNSDLEELIDFDYTKDGGEDANK